MNELPKVAKPEHLQIAIADARRTLRLMDKTEEGSHYPENLLGWSITVTCMRLLRGVYGSDIETLKALIRLVDENIKSTHHMAMLHAADMCPAEHRSDGANHTHRCLEGFRHWEDPSAIHKCACGAEWRDDQ